MRAKDVMTTGVVTVTPEATVSEIAALLYERRISGVPVLRNGELVGIVSEGDLIRRQEIGSDRPRRSWWLSLFGDTASAQRYIKSHGKRATDVMTTAPVTVDEDTPVAEIARLFEEKHIKRVPVVRNRKVVGIVSRANLVQALAGAAPALPALAASDDAIRKSLLSELQGQAWWTGPNANVTVSNGVVHLWGFYDRDSERQAARIAAENVPGVKKVEDHRIRYAAAIGAV